MDCFLASTAQLLRPKKKAKLEHLSSITIGYLATRDGSRKAKHWKRMKILFDSGCAATLVNELVSNLRQTRDKKTKWRTKAGKFTTTNKCNITFNLPAFYEHREITWNCYVDNTNNNLSQYDLIIGRDLMHEIGINILFKDAVLEWDGATIPMQSIDKLDETYIDEFIYKANYFVRTFKCGFFLLVTSGQIPGLSHITTCTCIMFKELCSFS